ncbi:molecular chaperone Hsp33 [Cyclonatronum proteinivorum]|uniref:33 kDa chaperonin n=1 Tax=Cyclonatronum proteinivorum TaxID=1457365 RepID=A0A345UH52_9BACT|nr:Hsp33 family molecular chaperone HslO [Cyclonatronum proteinivorum]AXI99803.1 molecular chaperone Hsp33 [Cyclonatronum proteinivorum]
MNKEDFLIKDRIIKGITNDGHFRISVIKTTEVVQLAAQKHELSLLNKVVLGRALTGTMLLASSLKGEERLRLRMEGKGPIGVLVTEANSVGEIRGFVQNPDAAIDPKTQDIGDGLGLGLLTVTKTLYNEADQISGTVELTDGTVSPDIAYYLAQSEQIPSAIHLDVKLDDSGDVTSAGGVLIQALPDAPENKILTLQENLRQMKPAGERFLQGDYIDTIMHDIGRPYTVKELSRGPVHFFCRCTKDRFLSALQMLGKDDLESISDEGQELVCQFCNEKYHISQQEIKGILREKQIQMN